MELDKKTVERIMKKYAREFYELEYYDKTHKKLWVRERLDVTLSARVIKKLRDLKQKTGKPVSRIIEEAVANI